MQGFWVKSEMKKLYNILISIILSQGFLLPMLCVVSQLLHEFRFVFKYGFVYELILLSLQIFAFCVAFKNKEKLAKPFGVLTAILPIVMLLASAAYILLCGSPEILDWILAAANAVFSVAVAAFHARPQWLRWLCVGVSGGALWLCVLSPLAIIMIMFASIGTVEVVERVESPNGTYYAELINVDEGALGGDTLIKVYKSLRSDLGVAEISDDGEIIYKGPWGNFDCMDLSWKEEDILLVYNSEYGTYTEYDID